jgi:cbb3-type cytochrome oxidase maturation protein
MEISGTLTMMLIVGLILSFSILGVFIWGAKQGQFDDGEKMMGGLLFDSTEDLNDAIEKQKKEEELNKQKEEKSAEAKTHLD